MKSNLKLGLAVVLMGLFASFLMGGNRDNPAQIPSLIRNGALVIDVRSPGEFAGGHAEGAVNIPFDRIGSAIESVEPDRNRMLIVYCHTGPRAAVAKRSLASAGYTNVFNAGSLRAVRRALQP